MRLSTPKLFFKDVTNYFGYKFRRNFLPALPLPSSNISAFWCWWWAWGKCILAECWWWGVCMHTRCVLCIRCYAWQRKWWTVAISHLRLARSENSNNKKWNIYILLCANCTCGTSKTFGSEIKKEKERENGNFSAYFFFLCSRAADITSINNAVSALITQND